MPRADRGTDVSPGSAAVRRPSPGTVWEQITIQGAAGSTQPEWTAAMCTHDLAYAAADAIDWPAARTITEYPLRIWVFRWCPRTDCTKKPICHAAPGQRVRGWRCGGCAVTAADRTIRWSTAVALIEVAAVAAVVSYEHAYALVCAHGETGWTARWLLGLGSRRRSLRTWPTAWATAWSERSWRCGLLWVALVGSYELLMIIIRSAQVSAEMYSEVVVRVPDPPPSQPGWSGSV